MTPQTDKTREFRRLLTAALAIRRVVADRISQGCTRAEQHQDIEAYKQIMASARRLLLVVVALLVATFTTCCVSQPRPVPGQTSEIGFQVQQVQVRFKRIGGGDYNAIVQEVALDDGTNLVECFRVGKGGYVWDRHSWSTSTEVRSMKVYLAKVEGVDWNAIGFAHLPQNMDGSVKTTVGSGFNYNYQKDHETRGKVVSASREYFTWSIASGLQRVVVEAP